MSESNLLIIGSNTILAMFDYSNLNFKAFNFHLRHLGAFEGVGSGKADHFFYFLFFKKKFGRGYFFKAIFYCLLLHKDSKSDKLLVHDN